MTGATQPTVLAERATLAPPSRWQVPLADVAIADEDIAAVVETYRSGWLSMGPRTEAFEAAVAAYSGAPHAFAVANCTAALHLLCLAAGLGPGDEVIVPSLTFVATANAVAYTGATPVFAEIAGLAAPWLDPARVEAAITGRTKAIMMMAYGGHPGSTIEIAAIAERHGLLLLEDAAHAIGTRLADGRQLGTIGAGGAFSFFSNKNLAIGEGGMVVCHDDELAARVKLLRSHGMTTLSWDRHRGHASSYDVVALGCNYRIDEARAALGTSRLPRLDRENAQRSQHVARYRELLAGIDGVSPALPELPEATLAHHLFTVTVDRSVNRDAVRQALADRGVQTSMHYPPVHRFQIYAPSSADLPLTDEYASRTITLPLYAQLSHEQIELVCESLRDAIGAHA